MGRDRAALWVAAFILLAGCVDAPTPSEGAQTSAAAAPPTLDASTGLVEGLIVTDERMPIAGADVSLVEPGLETKTNDEGRFAFPPVEPGSYRLVAGRLGYESVARKIEVRGGESTRVEIQLRGVVAADEFHVLVLPRVTVIHLGPAFAYSWVVAAANQSTVNGLFCEPCWHILHFPKAPSAGLTEPLWSGGSACPGVNCEVWIFYKSSWTNAHSLSDGEMAFSGNYNNREPIMWPKTSLNYFKAKDKAMLVASNGVTYPVVELRVTTYTSLGYGGELPDGYTALPPP